MSARRRGLPPAASPALVALACILAPAASGLSGAAAQTPPSVEPAVEPEPPPAGAAAPAAAPRFAPGEYVGPASCATANCHGRGGPGDTYRVLQNEYTQWVTRDVHFRAHESLFGELAQVIQLNLDTETPARADPRCLSCHALSVPQRLQARPLDLEDGISCERCHGPAGGWIDRHADEDWSHGDSVEAGMIDLQHPKRRAALCLGCHLGAGERQVDHELIAAGHPELVFELDNFSEVMPSHWRTYTQLAPEERGIRHPARIWALGQAETFRQGLLLLARRAAPGSWPEFGEMRCTSCHHSLAEQWWRRGRMGRRPGVPPWSPARWAVLRHLVDAHAGERREALDREIASLAARVEDLRSPPGEIQAAALGIAAELEAVIDRLDRVRWGPGAVRDLIGRITADLDFLRRSDRQSAEQAALAVQTLYSSLVADEPRRASTAARAELDALFDTLEDPYDYEPERFTASLDRLGKSLR